MSNANFVCVCNWPYHLLLFMVQMSLHDLEKMERITFSSVIYRKYTNDDNATTVMLSFCRQ